MLMQDAARVACVSRAFARSWRCHPNLILSEESLGLNKITCQEGKRRNFTSTVDDIMKSHSGNGVKKLKVHVSSVHNKDSSLLDNLDSWLQHAVKPGIEELIISLPSMNGSYNFPCELLSGGTADSLRYLYLASCIFHHTFKISCLGSLTRLQIYMVHIKDNELSCLLSNSLALEQLELRHCSTIKCLKVPCLQQLSYIGVTFCTKLQVIESKAPNLSSFRFFSKSPHVQLALGETLQIKKLDIMCNGAAFYALTELPSRMSNLEILNIHSQSEMVNAPMVPSTFCNLRFLSIALGGVAYDYLSLASFFYASPCLETFSLNVIMPGYVELPSVFADPSGLRMMPQHRHKNLRRVEIYNFSSGKSLVELICHIVQSTLSLECLTLDTTEGLPRCSVNKSGRCCMMRPGAVVEAQKALLAVQMYIKWKVPSTVEFIVLEPCRQCHG